MEIKTIEQVKEELLDWRKKQFSRPTYCGVPVSELSREDLITLLNKLYMQSTQDNFGSELEN